MTNGELIEALKKLPKDYQVYTLRDQEENFIIEVEGVDCVTVNTNKMCIDEENPKGSPAIILWDI
jgi:hypothetical protein